MIFKTYENDLDGIFNKLGFNKRTFAEWGSQVKEAFNGAETGANKFYTTLNKISSVMKTAFTVPKDKLDWTKNSQDEIVTKNNIDSYIPQLSQDKADGLVKSIQAQSIAVTNGTKNWQDYFQKLDGKKQGHITELIKNTKDLSKLTGDDLVQATNAARESALKHNAALQQETLGAKAATLGLKALSVAGNIAFSMGVSIAISAIIEKYNELAHAAENCKERVDSLISSYDSKLNNANSNISKTEELADEYETLSKGVSSLGANLTLTTSEYERYNSIVNDIADMFPSLISGYTAEGNAILTLKGNVEELRDAYKDAQKEAYNMLISSPKDANGNDILQNAQDVLNGVHDGLFQKRTMSSTQIVDRLSELQKALGDSSKTKKAYEHISKLATTDNEGYHSDEFQSILEEIGIKEMQDSGWIYRTNDSKEKWSKVSDVLLEHKGELDAIIQQYQSKINTVVDNSKKLANAYLGVNETYEGLDENTQKSASILVNSLTDDMVKNFTTSADVGSYVNNIVDLLNNNSTIKDTLNNLFSLDSSNLSPVETSEQVDKYIAIIAQALDEDENQLKIRLGFEDTDDLEVKYKNIISSLQKKFGNDNFDWEAWFKENSINTKEELDAWLQVTAGINDAAQARKAYLDYMDKQELDTKSLKELNDSLDKIQSAYQTVSTAIQEYNENGYISVDTFQSLMELEPEYLNLLMDENGTLALTSENLYKLTKARINDLAAKQASTLVDSVTKLGSEAEQLDYLTQSTKEATESTWGLVYAKIAEAQAAGTISDDVAGRLKSQVEAYQTWANAAIDGINKGSLGKSSNSSKSEKDKAKALKDYNDKLKDINEKLEELDKEEHLANLKYSIETITQDLDKFEQSLDRLSSKLDLTFEKDYSAKLSIIGQQFLGASRYGGEMRVELERLLAIEPQTADEAEELASRLESLSDSFFENEKNIIEYRNSLFETATDYLGESASATVEQVNNAKSILDNTFNVIKNGSLSGDGFWSATLLPSISKDKVTKQRAENNKLIKEEKRYQNAIAKIRKKATDMSYAEEKEEREKQRQEYQEELQEAYEDYQDKINDVIGQNIEVSDSVKNIGDEYMNTADKAENAAQRMSDAMNNINWEQRSYANKSYTYEDGAPTSAQYQYAYGDSKSTVVVTKKAQGGTTSQGLTITGDGTGAYAGQEAYIGQDGKLHLFNNEAQLSELPPNTRIVNAKDLQNIIKYTGMKYFYQPIENIQSATVDKFAQGNTNVSFSPIPYNALSTQALYSDVNVQAMVEETIAEINNEFNSLKGNIKFSAVQNAFKNSLTDKKMYEDLSNTIVNMTSQSLDKADKSTLSDSVVGLILQNSAWNDLPNELQNKLSELNVNADNWTDWIKDSNNSLQAFNLMQDGGMSSWDLLDSNVTSLLQQAGINGKDAWDKFVQDDPLQALTLLSSSWNSMNDTIGQYMTDAQTIAANGARAIQSLQIIAPSISEQSWNALQVLIANKIQEIISLMNEVFGENTVDMNFAINVNNGALSGNSQTNPQGDNEIINTAKSFLGTPYQWGGTSPSGFDCSGFTQYVLAQNGKSIPRTSQEQFASGQAVDKSQLQAGDLVFYDWSGGTEATHVGIYEGNGKMIHAPHSGDVVKEVDFNSYGQNVYLGARRYYKGTEGALPGLAKLGDEAEVRGLNYPTPEILIRQKTGKAYLTGLDGTQIVNLDRGDTVIPYADTKRILNGNVLHAYANGTPNAKDAISKILGINNVKNRVNNGSTRSNNSGITNNTVQQSWDTNDFGQGVGKSHSYTAFDENGYLGSSLGYWDTSSSAWKLFKKLLDSGDLSTDENGIYTYKGARLVAMTSTFGKPGDVMRYTQDDGSVFYGIIMDEKSQAYTWYDNNPANKWGHNNGQDMVEFEVKKSAIAPAYKANGGTPPYGNLNHAITLIENLGSLEGFDFSDMPSVGGTSVLTQKMQEFMSKLQQVYGTFKTNTHTSATKVGNVKSLGDKKQSNYSFQVPFTQKEKGGIVPADTIAQVNEHDKPEATIDEKGNFVPLGDGTSQVFVSDKPFPVINADDYAKIKKYGGDKKPVQFLKNGNTSVSVNTDNTDEEKEQTAEERKAEENTSKINQTLKSIESKLDSGVLSDDIKKLDLPTLEAIDKLTDSWGDDDTITSDILMQFKDYAKDFADYEKWAEDDLSNILNSYSEDFYEKYYAEKDKYDSWQSDFKERFKKWVEHPTDGNYMSDYFKFADEASKKATESLITQQTLVADNMKDALDELKDKSEVLKKLIQDAPTAELAQKARDELKDINENIDEIESNYADTMEQITERKLQDISNRDSKYTRETGMLQYDRNILQDQYNRSTDDEEKAKLAKEIIESMKKERDIEQERVDAAHKANQEIYENATGQRKTVLENVKMSELYNADGSFNDAAYNETVELLEGIGGSDLVQVFKQLASEMQKNSQVYLEGTENIRNLNNEIQDQEQEEANQKIELETSRYEKLNKILDVRLNKEKAITSALQEQYSFQQSLRDAALDYQSELIANKNLSQWLDDDTRALLFNENDYSDMMNTINGLNNEMARAYKKYKSDISTLGEEDYYQEQQITNAYNRRIEQLKEQLEVAKQNLEVTKKNAEFQNTLKERDTRILVGDRWVNVADPEKLYNTQLEATKAQMSLDNIMQDNAENQNVRDMEVQSDITQKMISANDKYIEVLNGLSDDEKKRHAETLESTEALIASNIMLGGSNIGWANEYSTSDESFNGQVAGLNNVEIGRQFYYNKDYDLNQSSLDDLLKDGVISEEIHKAFSKINETHRNNKLTADPVNSKYAPQTFEHGGLESTSPMGANGDAKVQMKQAEQTEQITDYAAELEKYYELAKKQNGYLSAEDRAKAQRLEIARNIKVANSPLNYEQTSDFGAPIFANDFSQDYSDIENFCKENGGLTEQEAIFFDSWHASHEEYIALADMLLSTGQDNTKLLSTLNEQLGIKLSEMITNKIEEYNANLPSVGSIATAHYATGTKSAKGGLAITDEDGYEAKLRKLSVGRYSMLNAGDMVFDKEATDVLWEFAKNPQNFIDQVSIFKQSPQQMPATNNSTSTTESITFTGDINVTDPVPDANAFVDSLTDKVKSQYPIIKNTKI